MGSGRQEEASAVAALDEPLRRRLYDFVAQSGSPVGREAAANETGTSRTLAAYHLDRLVDAGLLTTEYARQNGKTGPGAGRPAKLYSVVHDEVSVSIPPRSYGLLARLLAGAAASDESGAVRHALSEAAKAEGVAAAKQAGDFVGCLEAAGYDPEVRSDGTVELLNCPFHQIARQHTDLVCGMNHSLIGGMLEGSGDDPDRAELAPRAGRCCVIVHPH